MNFSAPFIRRPIATTLLTDGAGPVRHRGVSRAARVAACRKSTFPTISVQAQLPGASPEIMASSVATPLERAFGRIAAVTEMSSQSTLGPNQHHPAVRPVAQHRCRNPRRRIGHQCRALSFLPANLPSNPTYRKVNPADAPIMILALTSDKVPPVRAVRCRLHRAGTEALANRRRRPGHCRRQLRPRGPRECKSHPTLRLRHQSRDAYARPSRDRRRTRRRESSKMLADAGSFAPTTNSRRRPTMRRSSCPTVTGSP